MIGSLKQEVYRILLAAEFLTRVPVAPAAAYSPSRFSESVRHYPLVGLIIGSCAAGVFVICTVLLPHTVAVLLSTAATMLLTGAFHEDGLADTFDGIGGGVTAERSLEIMRDSRLGTYGTAALLMALLLKVSALNSLSAAATAVALICAHGLSRWSSVLVIATSTYVRSEGTGKPTAAGISSGALVFASVIALSSFLLPLTYLSAAAAAGALGGMAAGHVLMRLFFERKIGGYTGDCLGAVQQVSELGIYLGILACL